MPRFSTGASDVVRPGVRVNLRSTLARRRRGLECRERETDQFTIFEILGFTELLARESKYIDDVRVCPRKDDDGRHLLAGARAYGSVYPGHVFISATTDARATIERSKAALCLSSSVGEPFLIGFIALLQRLDPCREHLLKTGKTASGDLPLRVTRDILGQAGEVEIASHGRLRDLRPLCQTGRPRTINENVLPRDGARGGPRFQPTALSCPVG